MNTYFQMLVCKVSGNMMRRRLHQLLLAISLNMLLCCNNNKSEQLTSQAINSNEGVSDEALSLIFNGPKGFTLDYFPRSAIRLASVNGCEITERDSASNRIARKIQFEKYPTWNKEETYRFLAARDTVIVETVIEDKTIAQEKYQLIFDGSNRLKPVNTFRNGFLTETTDYTIQEFRYYHAAK